MAHIFEKGGEMQKRIVSIVLAVLLMGLMVLPGCVSKAELDECRALVAEKAAQIEEQEAQINELEVQIVAFNSTIEAKDTEIAELEEENTKLKTEIEKIEFLKIQASQMDSAEIEIVGTITGRETVKLQQKFFPKAFRTTEARITKSLDSPQELVSLQTLKRFLAKDKTYCGMAASFCRKTKNPGVDELAFRLKVHWMMAGIPPWSLGLIRTEVGWYNIFLTVENDEYVLYEVIPLTEEIIKLEKPDSKVCRAMMGDSF